MADEEVRRLERRAAQGDIEAQRRLRAVRCRIGQHAWGEEWWRSLVHLRKWRHCVGCGAKQDGGEFPPDELPRIEGGIEPGSPELLRYARRRYGTKEVVDLVVVDGSSGVFVQLREPF